MSQRNRHFALARRTIAVAWLAAGPLVAAQEMSLEPIPWPELAGMETAIQEQLRAVRADLEAMIAEPAVDRGELANAYGMAGQVYLVYSLVDSSRACLANAVTLAPEDFRWNFYLGRTLQEDGEPQEAGVYLAKAHALRPTDLPTLIRLARSELALERLQEAEEYFLRALELDPGNAAALFGLGQAAYKRQDYGEAVQRFEAALMSQPRATAIHYPLALAYRDMGEAQQGRRHLALRGPREVQFEEPLMEELRSFVRGGSLLVYSATHARAAGDLEAAAQGFRQALGIDPGNNSARLNLASTLIQKGDLTGAQRVLEEALEYDATNSSAHYNLGLILEQNGQRQEALQHLQQAAELAPDFVDAHLNYGLSLQEAGRLEEAEKQYAMAAELDPTDAEIRFRHASVLVQLQQLPQAIAELELALDVQPEAVDGHLLMARARGASGDFAGSAASFARVLALDPGNQEALFARSLALLLAQRYPEALRHLEESLDSHPSNLDLKHILARLLVTCPDETIRDGERGLRLAQEVIAQQLTFDHGETVAMALAEMGRFEEAQALQQQIIEQASRMGDPQLSARLRRNLEAYRARQPVRAPWQQGI